MEGNTGKFVDLVDDFVKYTGPKELTQYFVKQTDMKITDFGSRMGVLVISMTLGLSMTYGYYTYSFPSYSIVESDWTRN